MTPVATMSMSRAVIGSSIIITRKVTYWFPISHRHGGMAFMELVNEGRLLSHAMRERIVMTTSEAFVIVNKLEEISRQKHMQFVELCRLTEATYNENDKLQDQLLLATKRRDFSVARNVIQKVYKTVF